MSTSGGDSVCSPSPSRHPSSSSNPFSNILNLKGLPFNQGPSGVASGKESACQCRSCKRHRFDLSVRKIPWSRKWKLTPVFSPGESDGQRSLVGYSPWGHTESDMTEHTCTHAPFQPTQAYLSCLTCCLALVMCLGKISSK